MGIELNLLIFQDIMLEIYAKGESILKANHFAPKKMMYNKYSRTQ